MPSLIPLEPLLLQETRIVRQKVRYSSYPHFLRMIHYSSKQGCRPRSEMKKKKKIEKDHV
jgi:hypothetical protein